MQFIMDFLWLSEKTDSYFPSQIKQADFLMVKSLN
jgi:hypothetical protein